MVKLFLDFFEVIHGVLDKDFIPGCVQAQLLCVVSGGFVGASEESFGLAKCVVRFEVADEWLKFHVESFREETQVQLRVDIQTDEFEDFSDDEFASEQFGELDDVAFCVEAPCFQVDSEMVDGHRSVHFLQSLHEAFDHDGAFFVGALASQDKMKTPNVDTTTADSSTPKESLWLADDAEPVPELLDSDGVLGEHEVAASMVEFVASYPSVHSRRFHSSWASTHLTRKRPRQMFPFGRPSTREATWRDPLAADMAKVKIFPMMP